jgi:hypothetical protein
VPRHQPSYLPGPCGSSERCFPVLFAACEGTEIHSKSARGNSGRREERRVTTKRHSSSTQQPLSAGEGGDRHTGPDDGPALPALLERPARESGERWAARVVSRMHLERRRVCGGWPGTLTEAQALTHQEVLPRLSTEELRELDLVDHDQVARVLYRSARDYWVRRQSRPPSRDPAEEAIH